MQQRVYQGLSIFLWEINGKNDIALALLHCAMSSLKHPRISASATGSIGQELASPVIVSNELSLLSHGRLTSSHHLVLTILIHRRSNTYTPVLMIHRLCINLNRLYKHI